MFYSYDATKAIVADRSRSLRREARNHRLIELARGVRRTDCPSNGVMRAA